jgi:hypothetical protein
MTTIEPVRRSTSPSIEEKENCNVCILWLIRYQR